MRRRLLVRLLGSLLTATLLPGRAAAQLGQLVHLTPNGGEVGVEARAVQLAGGNRGAPWETFVSTWVNVPFSGSVLSPRLLSYQAAFRPTRSQQSTRGQQSLYELRSLGMNYSANLLPASPISLSMHGDRTTAGTPGNALGTSTSSRNGSSGGSLRVRMPAFPLRLEWNTRDLADSWRASLEQVPIRRDESFEVLRLTGESSKLTTSVERQRFVDRIGTLDFSSVVGTALHALRWGAGSSLTTSAEMHRRDGRDQYRSRLFTERLHLQHSPTVASDLTVHRQRSRSQGDYIANVATTMLSVQAEPRPWLSGGVSGMYSTNEFSHGSQRTASATPSLTLRRALPRQVRLVGTVGASYQRTDQVLTDQMPTPVTDESHTLDASRQFQLRHERAEALTVVVFNRNRTVLYLEGTDYRVVALGDLVRLEVPIVSRIQVGDGLLISYSYAAAAAPAHDLRSGSASLSLVRGGVSLSQSAQLRWARVLAGDDAMGLEGGDDYVTALDVRREVGGGQASVNAQHRARRRALSDFTSSELRVGYSPAAVRDFQSTLGASLSRSSAAAQVEQVEQVATVWSTNASVTWMPRQQLHLLAAAESQVWRLANRGSDRTLMFNLDLRWIVGRVETEWRYLWQQRSMLEQQQLQHRFFVRLLRRF